MAAAQRIRLLHRRGHAGAPPDRVVPHRAQLAAAAGGGRALRGHGGALAGQRLCLLRGRRGPAGPGAGTELVGAQDPQGPEVGTAGHGAGTGAPCSQRAFTKVSSPWLSVRKISSCTLRISTAISCSLRARRACACSMACSADFWTLRVLST